MLQQIQKAAIRDWTAHRIFDAFPHSYLILNRDLLIVDVNKEYAGNTFTDPDLILGRCIFDVFPDNPGDPNANGVRNLSTSLRQVINSRAQHAMPWQRYDVRNRDGVFVERHWSPLNKPVLDSNGDVEFIVHAVSDVTALALRAKRYFSESAS
jgi:hypothetical protein